jgi:hypothetical protein
VPAAAAAVPALPPVERDSAAAALSATVPLLGTPSRLCPAHRAERSHVNDREVVVRPAELEVAPDGF